MPQQPNSRRQSHAGRNSPRVSEVISTEHHSLNRGNQSPPNKTREEGYYGQQKPLSQADSGYRGQYRPKVSKPEQPSITPEVKTVAETNSAYQSVDLPSGFKFYDFKRLSIRPLKASDQAKLYQATSRNSLRHTVEAISATLGDGVSAFDLTVQDFYWVMYWQRTNSFLKTPMLVTGFCSDPEHNTKVVVGFFNEKTQEIEKLPEESLKLSVQVNSTTLTVQNLEYEIEEGKWPLIEHLGLGVETMRDIVWASENIADSKDLEVLEWKAGYASFLRPIDADDDLGKRMARIEDLSPEQIQELEDYSRAVTSYGVTDTATVKCKECGASNKVVIPIDASCFLPNSRRR